MYDLLADLLQILNAVSSRCSLRKDVAKRMKVDEGVINVIRFVGWQSVTVAVVQILKFAVIDSEDLPFGVEVRRFKQIGPLLERRYGGFRRVALLQSQARAGVFIAVFSSKPGGNAFETKPVNISANPFSIRRKGDEPRFHQKILSLL